MGDWVLVVEDQRVDALVLESSVRQAADIPVRQAGTILAAQALLKNNPPTLVLLDLALPDGDGTQLLRWMKEHDMANVPVVVVTSNGDARRRVATAAAGAAEHIVKPLELEAMENVVRHSVQRWIGQVAAPAD